NSTLAGQDSSDTWCFDVQYRESDEVVDDVRLTWELNRLTWLLPLAVQANYAHDEKACNFVVDAVKSFLASDRVGYGARWNSMIELSMQSLSLILLDSMMSTVRSWEPLRDDLSFALRQRYRWIEALPSLHSSANNHRIAELAALSATAHVLSELESECPNHLDELAAESRKQFGSDGFNAELSFDYHLYSLDLIVTVIELVGHTAKERLGPLALEVSQLTLDLWNFTGLWPTVADSDEACLISAVTRPVDRPISIARLAGGVESQPPPEENIFSLPSAGYTFLRDNWGDHEALLLSDHGELGYGRIAAHAHADTLGIWLWVDGAAWLADAGTFSYHSNSELRDRLRSSDMHNCITVNGASSSVPDGPFLWNPKRTAADVALDAISSDPELQMTTKATLPKLKGIRPSCTQLRRVTLHHGQLRVEDKVTSRTGVESAQHFLLAPGFQVADAGSGPTNSISFVKQGTGTMAFSFDEGCVTLTVDEVPVSPSYGKLESAVRVSFHSVKAQKNFLAETTIKLIPEVPKNTDIR
ncbi:MAG: heparinase II/III-family protein, partial [Actinomycetes bacterium]